MYLAAYAVTASILGVAGDQLGGVSPMWALLIGVGGASLPVGLAAWFGRKKTDVDVSRAITDAAAELLKQYRQRDLELEARLSLAEKASIAAQLSAASAQIAETECRQRLSALEAKVGAMGQAAIGDPA